MTCKRPLVSSLVAILFIFKIGITFAQSPVISYPGPQTYTTNVPIKPLAPVSTGGQVPDGAVTTSAGNGNSGSANGQGAVSTFSSPTGVTVDGGGNVYIADSFNSLIRQVTPIKTVSTLAGNGSGNNNGNGVLATFRNPLGVAIDLLGNIYVADAGNNLIRKIDRAGNVTTLAGSGSSGSANNNNPASATFNHPDGVAVDNTGNIYVVESANNRIRKINPQGVVTTLAGSGASGWADGNGPGAIFNHPQGITVDNNGIIYIADSHNNRIRKITPGGTVTTIAGSGAVGSQNGIGTSSRFNNPVGIAVDRVGNVYVGDQLNNQIRKIDPNGVVSTLAGTGSPGAVDGAGITASFDNPSGITIDGAGNLYVADTKNNEIRKVVTTGFDINKPLPPGLIFDTTTGVITGTPTATWPLTTYTITAYNTQGSNTATVDIRVLSSDNFIYGLIPVKTICDVDFDPGATATLPITYTSSNPGIATIVGNKIHITGVGTSDIVATDGVSTGAQTLIVTPPVTPTISIAPPLTIVCPGSTITYISTITNGGPNPMYQWQLNGQNSGTNSPQYTSSSLTIGDKVTCTLTSNALCTTLSTVKSNTINYMSSAPANVSVNIASSAIVPVCSGVNITFTATAVTTDKNPTYQWQVNGISKGTNSPFFSSTTLADNDVVTCVLTANDPCQVTPAVTSNPIKVALSPESTCLIVIPNAFTPNGDGVNDVWNITDLQNFPGCTVAIYNRYGRLVYNSINYPKSWDGTYNGKALPAGTYYYIINPKNGAKELAGYVEILR